FQPILAFILLKNPGHTPSGSGLVDLLPSLDKADLPTSDASDRIHGEAGVTMNYRRLITRALTVRNGNRDIHLLSGGIGCHYRSHLSFMKAIGHQQSLNDGHAIFQVFFP